MHTEYLREVVREHITTVLNKEESELYVSIAEFEEPYVQGTRKESGHYNSGQASSWILEAPQSTWARNTPHRGHY